MLVSLLGFLTLTDGVTVETVMSAHAVARHPVAFDSPARQAFVAELVGLDDLRNAIALNSMLFNVARLIGPAVGGAIVACFGEGWCFVLKALAYVPTSGHAHQTEGRCARSARGLAGTFLRPNAPRLCLHPQPTRLGPASPRSGRHLHASPACPYFSFLPRRWRNTMLGSDATVAGMLMSLTGIGAVIAAILLTVFDRLSILRLYPGWSALLLGLTQIGIGLLDQPSAHGAAGLADGFCHPVAESQASNSLLQQFTPSAFRGRVMAMYAMMMLGDGAARLAA